jgi:hypothetical protein
MRKLTQIFILIKKITVLLFYDISSKLIARKKKMKTEKKKLIRYFLINS